MNEKMFDKKRKIPMITIILIMLNIVGMVLEIIVYHTASPVFEIMKGAFFSPSFKYGEWWRIFTSAFFHLGWVSLVVDIIALFIIGTRIEKIYTKVQYLIIFLTGTAVGNLFQYIYEEIFRKGQNFASRELVGTSATILGLAGAYLIALLDEHNRDKQKDVVLCAGTVIIMLLATHGTGTGILALFGSLTGAILISEVLLKCGNKWNVKK